MENLKKVYNPILPSEEVEHDGIPRTILFCYNANATPKLAVATSPEKWWPGSFLMHWAAISRQSRLGVEGQQAIKNLINQVDSKVREEVAKANLPNQRLGVKNLAMIGDSFLELKSFAAQAFDGKSFLPRERCWRCRLTFGFTWLWPEGHPQGLSVAKIKDFEFRYLRYYKGRRREMCGIYSVVEHNCQDDTKINTLTFIYFWLNTRKSQCSPSLQ